MTTPVFDPLAFLTSLEQLLQASDDLGGTDAVLAVLESLRTQLSPPAAPSSEDTPEDAKAEDAALAERSRLRRDRRHERITGYIPRDLERELRIHCARKRRSFSDALTEAVNMLLRSESAVAAEEL